MQHAGAMHNFNRRTFKNIIRKQLYALAKTVQNKLCTHTYFQLLPTTILDKDEVDKINSLNSVAFRLTAWKPVVHNAEAERKYRTDSCYYSSKTMTDMYSNWLCC